MNDIQAIKSELQFKYASNYSKPTLPQVLTEYGLVDQEALKCRNEVKETHRKQRKAAKKKTLDQLINFEDEKARKRQNERDEYYLKLIQNMYRLRDYYYKEYTKRLSQKVERQKKEIRERDLKSKEKRDKKEEEERKASHKIKKRLEYHTLETSAASSDISKTDFYHIVGLENTLVQEGKLKSSDYNKLRLKTQDPHIFYANFKVKKTSDLIPNNGQKSADFVLPLTAEKLLQIHQSNQELRSLSQISERGESSRPESHTDSWAITQHYPSQYKMYTSFSGLHSRRPRQESHSDLDKRFPKVEMPKLHCFDMNLASKPPDPDQVQQKAELRAREKHRKRLMRKVAKMYQLAMSNIATSARILDKHEDMGLLINGPDLCDLISDNYWMEAYRVRVNEETDQTNNQNSRRIILQQAQEQIKASEIEQVKEKRKHGTTDTVKEQTELDGKEVFKEQSEADVITSLIISREHSSASRRSEAKVSRESSAKTEKSLPAEDMDLPIPLTIEEIRDKCNIVEAKTLSTFWSNYMGAGK